MSKLAAIIGVGSFVSPWFSYTLASAHFCDEIIVINGGYDLKNPKVDEYNIPLEQASRDISNLNACGKIHEYVSPRNDFDTGRFKRLKMGLQLDGNERDWYDSAGLNYTYAMRVAKEHGCDWVLKIDSDQVAYVDCARLKTDLADQSLIAWMYEFRRDVWHLSDPGPDFPYNDSIFTHTPEGFYNGHACPQIDSTRRYCPDMHAAHLRFANPVDSTESERMEHFLGRAACRIWVNEGRTDCLEAAKPLALDQLRAVGKPATVNPPECTLLPRKNLAEWAELISRVRLEPIPLQAYRQEGWGK